MRLFRSTKSRRIQRKRSSRLEQAVACVVEPLETRLQLSASLTLNGAQTITPGSVVNASNDPNNYQSEMSVTVNPTNPLNLVGFSHRADPPGYTFDAMDVFYSTDAGATWTTTTIDENADGLGFASRFDPTVSFDANGKLFIAYGAVLGGFNNPGDTDLVVGRSLDGGATFDHFSVVDSGPDLDKWFLATGRDPSTGNQAVYVAYDQNVLEGGQFDQRIVVTGSNDGGINFTTPLIINDASINGTSPSNLFAGPAVGPNGELYVSWYNINDSQLLLDRDLDGLWGTTYDFGTDVVVRDLVNGSLYRTYVPGQPDRGIFTTPTIHVDRSGGAYNGRVYVSFVEWNDSSIYDSNVIVARSSDQGGTWSFATVDNSTGTEFLPWVDVDQTTGSTNVIYYTSDGDQASGNDDVLIRLATSLDGGANWSTANLTSITSNETGGFYGDYLDYIGLDVHDGTVHGLFSFRHDPNTDDLDALTVDAAFVNANNTLTINGDDGGVTRDDTILVRRSPVNTAYLEVFVNGQRQFTGRYDTVGKIIINGLNGNDNITVDPGVSIATTINGGAGNDTLKGGAGNDSLNGGAGNDTYVFAGSSSLGSDTISGEAANADTDTIDFSSIGYAVTLDLAITTPQTAATNLTLTLADPTAIENVTCGALADRVYGNTRNNSISGGAGNDFLQGRAGNDTLSADVGNDYLLGDDGNDTLYSGAGDDNAYGGNGNDYITGDDGNDFLYGDTTGTGAPGNDTLVGGAGNDAMYGNELNDTYVFAGSTSLGSDTITGEAANADTDTLDFSGMGFGVTLNLGITTPQTAASNLTLTFADATSIENVTGSAFADRVYGNTRNNSISGGAGNDDIEGRSGNDTLSADDGNDYLLGDDGNDTLYSGAGDDNAYGGNGNDYVSGDDGNDYLYGDTTGTGAPGNDTLLGGAGNDGLYGNQLNDLYVFAGSSSLGSDTITGEAANADTDTIDFSGIGYAVTINLGITTPQTVASNLTLTLADASAVENVTGGIYNDNITGNARNNTLYGGAGNDVIFGQDGDDFLHGNDGNDTVYGGNGSDQAYGGTGDDYVFGDAGNDFLYGLEGNDYIDGGSGSDQMYGNEGDDYLFANDGEQDTLDGGDGIDTADADGLDVLFNFP
jgi:Ca2+-binding RTX toxin-like protein